MIFSNKILPIVFGLFYAFNLSSQTLKGQIYNIEDSLPVSFASIAFYDISDKLLIATPTNIDGQFNIQIPNHPHYLRISNIGFADLKILNFTKELSDTIDLGQLPLIPTPIHLNVSYKGISVRKERRFQRQLVRDYNRHVMARKNQVVVINHRKVKMTVKKIKLKDYERLKLLYILELDEIEKN